ncbi:MAG: ATP-binding protein, partial [Sulfurovum sp.]|nr:ATP-binding protein [Sulfurovum sp.]
LASYFIALRHGFVVAYDEFDIGIHPDLLEMLLDIFDDPKINKKGAQLLFSTHHERLMDKLGKHRLIFVNKEENESYLYRLDELPGHILRKDRSMMPAYNSKKIGGRPKITREREEAYA